MKSWGEKGLRSYSVQGFEILILFRFWGLGMMGLQTCRFRVLRDLSLGVPDIYLWLWVNFESSQFWGEG